ncbi:hypothetical protein ElyMa_002714800 [Elysia marginata]|uniref:Uncharacterized protein n=1 Tax=Elysia marginata TaxID=1093978 RepID=A0AAV4HDG8_9GAST|nr:hypothetical protein ElyMa_002714800 [Elysia marginata]
MCKSSRCITALAISKKFHVQRITDFHSLRLFCRLMIFASSTPAQCPLGVGDILHRLIKALVWEYIGDTQTVGFRSMLPLSNYNSYCIYETSLTASLADGRSVKVVADDEGTRHGTRSCHNRRPHYIGLLYFD